MIAREYIKNILLSTFYFKFLIFFCCVSQVKNSKRELQGKIKHYKTMMFLFFVRQVKNSKRDVGKVIVFLNLRKLDKSCEVV
jgi:hypothetical protein